MMGFIKLLILLILLFLPYLSRGQHTPFNPISYRVFSPFIFNPAITGSKDYSSFNMIAALEGNSKSQIITADTRLSRKISNYFSAPGFTEYSNLGIGGAVFNDLNSLSQNIGVNVTGSCHIPLNIQKLSFLSLGASVKGVYNILKPDPLDDSLVNQANKKTFYPNLDLGMYYYGTNFYAGFSLTNLLGNPEEADNLGGYAIPVSQQYFILSGYKFLLFRPLNIVLEPSVIVTSDELTFHEIIDNAEPIIKIYLQDFCLGTYFNDKDRTSFFFQYRFPRICLGAFIELPRKSAYFKKEFIMELTAGINLSKNNYRFIKHSRW